MNHRLVNLKQISDIQEEQAKLRLTLERLQDGLVREDGRAVPANPILSTMHSEYKDKDKDKEQKEQKEIVFQVSPLTSPAHADAAGAAAATAGAAAGAKDIGIEDGASEGAQSKSSQPTPFNTPHHSPLLRGLSGTEALSGALTPAALSPAATNTLAGTTAPIPISMNQQKLEAADIADSLSYTPHFPSALQKVLVPVRSEPQQSFLCLPKDVQRILDDTESLHTKITQYKQQVQDGGNDEDDE